MTDRDVPPDDPTTVLPRAREHAGRHEPSSPTTTAENGGSTNRRVDPSALPLASPGRRKRRYGYGKVIGRGGMGEVLLAQDRRIGRSVALKVMLEEAATRADAHRRFLREARVQGQLEHPAIVPVYDLGWDREGRPYFAMKRISGVTLGDVIRELRKGDPDHENRYSLRRLISMFQQVCLAIEYAHSRGVVHRDLKPSNLMLGDFGEVYVLDWGIAKLLDTSEPSTSSLTLPLDTDDATRHDEVLGTIGYMAPEQLTSPTTVDARADVYSLGAVLFHILTLEPLHGYGTAQERARSTQLGAEARPTRRAPDRELPPELDGVCERATALNPNDRYQSARALHDALEAFLEGDRDTRLRAELAEQHVENARLAAQRMATDGPDASDQRKRALREAGRALALDPKDKEAAGIVARLMLEPPKEMPREVRNETKTVFLSEMRRGTRLASVALICFTATVIFLPLTNGVRSWQGVAAIALPLLIAGGYGIFASRTDERAFPLHTALLSIPVCFAIAALSGVIGSLLLAPALALAFAALVSVLHGLGRYRIVMIALSCAAWLLPAIFEWAGWLPSAYRFDEGVMTILPNITDLPETLVRPGLIAVNFATTAAVCGLLWRYSAWVAESRERLHLHAWHLENIAPSEQRERSPRSEPPPAPLDVTRH